LTTDVKLKPEPEEKISGSQAEGRLVPDMPDVSSPGEFLQDVTPAVRAARQVGHVYFHFRPYGRQITDESR